MTLFYCPTISSAQVLSEEESQHAIKVLRMQVGDEMVVVDGDGGYYKARISLPHHKHCGFEVLDTIRDYGKRPYRLHVAIAPTKNIERVEWFVEKATEIGIDEITPLLCRFSERKVVKQERLEKIIVSAAKQSVKAFFPTLNPLTTFDELLKKSANIEHKYIAHCYDGEKTLLKNAVIPGEETLILIGPEGDFSPEEVQKALDAGFRPISLGESRLRTETAALAACHTVALVNQNRA